MANKGTFQKGQSGNPNGKPKGTLAKTTKDIKEAYRQLIENNLDNLTGWLKEIAKDNPERAIRILADLSEFVIPKLARTESSINANLNIENTPLTPEEKQKILDNL